MKKRFNAVFTNTGNARKEFFFPEYTKLIRSGELIVEDYELRTVYTEYGSYDMDTFGGVKDITQHGWDLMDVVVQDITFKLLMDKIKDCPKYWAWSYHAEE